MKAKPAITLTRLWGEKWESWEVSPAPSSPKLLGPDSTGATADRVLAIPARLAVSAPLWVDSTDPQVIKESIELELEIRGLLPRRKSSDADFSRTLTVGGRTLVLCVVFPAEAPAPYEKQSFTNYEASPLLLDSQEDSVMLWREGDDLVAAFTRDGTMVYWGTLDWPADARRVGSWLTRTLLHLQATGVLISPPARIVIDSGLQKDGLSGLLPHLREEYAHFPPALGRRAFSWKPDSARENDRQDISSRKTRRLVTALAAVYLVVLVAAGLDYGWLLLRSRGLENQIAELKIETEKFQPVVREWTLLGPGADTSAFPLETLHGIVRNMPPSGIRLTIYDVTNGQVTIEGEAETASLATEFFTSLSNDTDLARMNWQMPAPALLPNNAARFQLSGLIP